MVTGTNELKTLTKHISCECKCTFDETKRYSNQWWNNDIRPCECKKHHICEKDYIWNPGTCICENGKYLASITDGSVITCDGIIDAEANLFEEKTNFYKKVACKTQNFYILLAF